MLGPVRIAAIAFAVTAFGAGHARADEPVRADRTDASVYPNSGARANALYGGAAAVAGWYGAALACSYFWPDNPVSSDLRIPVAGPWMALANVGCVEGDPDCTTLLVVARAAALTLDAVGQLGGIAVMAEGIFLPVRAGNERRLPKASSAKAARRHPARRYGVTLRPTVATSGRSVSVGLLGSF